MNTKDLARKAIQKLHDVYNAIPDDDSEDFNRKHYHKFEKAMEEAIAEIKLANENSEYAQMMKEADEWVEQMAQRYGTRQP